MTDRDACDACDDGNGECVYPYYGLAPHIHDTGPGWWLNVQLPREQWGDAFREDPECAGLGVYIRCPECGRGEPTMSKIDGQTPD